jgi:hypothetical protein
MAIIDPTSPALEGTTKQHWLDQISNFKILLYEVQKGIQTIISKGLKSYKLDTGQTNQEVERLSLASLQKMQNDLNSQIRDLEIKCGIGTPAVKYVRPGW